MLPHQENLILELDSAIFFLYFISFFPTLHLKNFFMSYFQASCHTPLSQPALPSSLQRSMMIKCLNTYNFAFVEQKRLLGFFMQNPWSRKRVCSLLFTIFSGRKWNDEKLWVLKRGQGAEDFSTAVVKRCRHCMFNKTCQMAKTYLIHFVFSAFNSITLKKFFNSFLFFFFALIVSAFVCKSEKERDREYGVSLVTLLYYFYILLPVSVKCFAFDFVNSVL